MWVDAIDPLLGFGSSEKFGSDCFCLINEGIRKGYVKACEDRKISLVLELACGEGRYTTVLDTFAV